MQATIKMIIKKQCKIKNKIFLCGRFEFDLNIRPLVMGIVNITDNSFSDGGLYYDTDLAINHAKKLISDGADILDIGGESTKPGAYPITAQEEISKLLPVIEDLRNLDIPLSIDTYKPAVMKIVLKNNADMINDVYSFQLPGSMDAIANSKCGLCIVHMQGEPSYMQYAPKYNNIVQDVKFFLDSKIRLMIKSGVSKNRILQDPGFGFGKTTNDNYELLNNLDKLDSNYPILTGLSRKSMIGNIINKSINDRLSGSIAGALACILKGSSIIRVHDVSETVDALKIWKKMDFFGLYNE